MPISGHNYKRKDVPYLVPRSKIPTNNTSFVILLVINALYGKSTL